MLLAFSDFLEISANFILAHALNLFLCEKSAITCSIA
jgi:hypothetical protein